MFEIKGKFSTAKVMTDNIEEEAIAQITSLRLDDNEDSLMKWLSC